MKKLKLAIVNDPVISLQKEIITHFLTTNTLYDKIKTDNLSVEEYWGVCKNAYCKRYERTENEILDIAGKLFGEKGYDATSTKNPLFKAHII